MNHGTKEPQTLVGIVLSDKRSTTRSVEVLWSIRHPQYKKVVRRRTRCQIHDPDNQSAVGDKVLIQQVRPVSKTKTWQLVNVIEKA